MMKFNPDIHSRRSVRLKGFDYSKAGAYFVTICTWDRGGLFGDILDGKMRLNEYGRVVENEWLKTKDIRNNVELDYYIVMPNHLHGILEINDCRGVLQYAPTENRKFQSPSQTIGAIVRGFKSAVTKQINEIRDNPGCPLWQRNYYERIIRSEEELNNIRQYIIDNPLKWELDEENPVNVKKYAPVEQQKNFCKRL